MESNARNPKTGHFLPGHGGGPGRTPEKTSAVQVRSFLQDMEAAWIEHGRALIEKVIKTEPAVALRIFSTLVPRELLVRQMGREKLIDPDAARTDITRMLIERDE